MKFRTWLENTELLILNEDYKTALEKFAKENPQTPREAIQKYIDEFRTIVTKKYRQINDAVPGLNVPLNRRTNIDAYPTFRDLEAVVDHVKGQVDFHGKVNFKDVEVDAKPVFENNNIVIYHADSPRACIKYKGNIPYSWCVARADAGNLYHAYRFKEHEPSFYFVKNKQRTQEEFKLWNLVKTSFEGKFKDAYHFFVIQSPKGANPKDHEKKQYVVTSANNDADKSMSWREIVTIEPSLQGLEDVFKNVPLSQDERQDHKEFSYGISDEKFAKLPYERKNRYMDIYVRLDKGLTDAQFASLPEDLKNKYIGFGVGLTNNQYESIKGTKLEKRYVGVTLEKLRNMAGRTDVPMELTRSEKQILLANPGRLDLSSITTENIAHLLGGMRKKLRRWEDEDGQEHDDEDAWEGEFEEISASRHARPEQRKEEQQMAELIVASKKDLDKYDIFALIKHSPDPGRTIRALGDKVKLLDGKMLEFVREYIRHAGPEYKKSISDGLFEKHPELDLNSLSHILSHAKDPEKVIQAILDRHRNKPLGHLVFQMIEKAQDKDKTLESLIQQKNVFSGMNPRDLGTFYFGNHHGDFFNSLRGERRQKLAERVAEDNKESLLGWKKEKYSSGHNPIAVLMLMASNKQRILDILGKEILEKVPEEDVETILRLSNPDEAEKFASFISEKLSHKNKISLIIRANDKIKVLNDLGQEAIDEISGADIIRMMDDMTMDSEGKRLVADEIAKRKSEFKWGGAHIYWDYVKKILAHVSDKLRSAMEIASKVSATLEKSEWHYFFDQIDLKEEDMQKLVEFTLKNKDMSDWDFNSVFARAPDKQRVIDVVGEERVRKAMKSKAFHSKSGPPLRDVYEKYK
jgi:hypothetical protein